MYRRRGRSTRARGHVVRRRPSCRVPVRGSPTSDAATGVALFQSGHATIRPRPARRSNALLASAAVEWRVEVTTSWGCGARSAAAAVSRTRCPGHDTPPEGWSTVTSVRPSWRLELDFGVPGSMCRALRSSPDPRARQSYNAFGWPGLVREAIAARGARSLAPLGVAGSQRHS